MTERQNFNKINPIKRGIFWALLVLSTITIICFGPELILRLIDPRGRAQLAMAIGIPLKSNYVDDPKLGYTARDPWYFWDNKKAMPSEEKPPRTIRVFAMGDSFVKAHSNIGITNSFYRVAARDLSELPNAPRYEWFHFGISGYCERQHLELIRRYGSRYHPDIIIIQVYLGNDIGENSGIIAQELQFADQGQRKSKDIAIRGEYRVPAQSLPETSQILQTLIDYSYFAKLLSERLNMMGLKLGLVSYSVIPGDVTNNHALDLMRKSSPVYIKDAWKVTENLIVEIKRETDVLGSRVLFVLVPKELQVDQRVWKQCVKDFNLQPNEYDCDQPNREFTNILARHGVDYIDLTPLFRDRIAKGIVLYDGHFNKDGHRIVGHAIPEALVERGFLP